jgi:tetratricopeptide (TPR) repeat protein
MRILLVVLLSLPTFSSLALAAQSPQALQKAIQATREPSEQAQLYKALGDLYVSQDKIDQAADAFIRALSLARDKFTPRERVQMAIYLSWANKLKEATKELNLILAADPENVAARSHLARVLSWSGDLTEAILQADRVLKKAPDHEDALLVEADALRWQGHFRDAIPIYRRLLGSKVDFDARLGLAYAYLATGNRTATLETIRLLKPANRPQQNHLKKLMVAINRDTAPRLDARYNYYSDSDDNRLNRYVLSSSFWVANVNLGADFRHINAKDNSRSNRAEDFSLKVYTNVTDSLGLGAGAGFTQLHDGNSSNFAIGHFKADMRVFNGSVGAGVAREVLSDTAELVQNRIRMTTAGFYVSQPLTNRLSVRGDYNYKDFSDNNHANDLQIVIQYAFYLNPKIAMGSRFRLLDFQRQSRDGYFDPNNYIANRFFASYYIEREWFYTYLDVFVGYQRFRRYGAVSNDFIHGGAASFGIKPTSNLAFEVNIDGGNFAAGSVSGFNYLNVGPRILFRF